MIGVNGRALGSRGVSTAPTPLNTCHSSAACFVRWWHRSLRMAARGDGGHVGLHMLSPIRQFTLILRQHVGPLAYHRDLAEDLGEQLLLGPPLRASLYPHVCALQGEGPHCREPPVEHPVYCCLNHLLDDRETLNDEAL